MRLFEGSALLAVDPSLSASGWVLFSVRTGLPHEYGIIRSPGTELSLSDRLNYMQADIEQLLSEKQLGDGDVLICEGPAHLVLNPDSSLKLERVRSTFEVVARSCGLLVPGRLNPRTVQAELLGMRGAQRPRKEVKAWARETAMRLHGELLEDIRTRTMPRARIVPQDVIDATLIGVLALTKMKHALQAGMSLNDAFAPREFADEFGRGRSLRWTNSALKKLQQ